MNNGEFLIWLNGFVRALDGPPTPKQWGEIVKELENVNFPIKSPKPMNEWDDFIQTIKKEYEQKHPNNHFSIWQEQHKEQPYRAGKIDVAVKYGDICPCNPINGGNGVCNCVRANEIVSKPLIGTQLTKNGYIDGKNVILTQPLNGTSTKFDPTSITYTTK